MIEEVDDFIDPLKLTISEDKDVVASAEVSF